MSGKLSGRGKTLLFLAGLLLVAAGVLLSSLSEVRVNSAAFPAVPAFYLCLVVLLLAAIGICGIVFLYLRKKPRLEICAAILMLFFGMIYMLVVLPFSSPDERSHYMTAYVLSDYMLGQEAFSADGTVMIREEDCLVSEYGNERLSENVGKADFQYFYDNLFARARKTNMVASDYDVRVYPNNMLARLPQALGLTLARLLRLSFPMTLLLGRFFGLLFFTVVFYYALRLMPRGKLAMAMAGLLPMTVSLAASYNYDVLTLSLSFLFVAYTFHLKYQEGTITGKQAVWMVVLLVLFTPWKMNYAVMTLLCLVLPKEKFKSSRAYSICAGAAIAAVALAVLLVNAGSLFGIVTGTDTALDYAQSESYTLGFLITHPVHSIKLAFTTLRLQTEWYYQTMIGQYLGQLDVGLEIYSGIVAGFLITALLSAVSVEGEEALYDRRDRRIVLALLLAMFLITELSMAVGWTPVTENKIVGVQGRYYLCVFPLALLLIQGKGITLKRSVSYSLLFSAALLHLLAIARIMERISYR